MTHRKKVAVRKRLRRRRALFREYGQEVVEFVEAKLIEGLIAEENKVIFYGEGRDADGGSHELGGILFQIQST